MIRLHSGRSFVLAIWCLLFIYLSYLRNSEILSLFNWLMCLKLRVLYSHAIPAVPLKRPSNSDCRVLTTWIDMITSSNSSLSEIPASESLVCSFDLPMTPTQKATSLLLAWISYVSRLTILLFYFYYYYYYFGRFKLSSIIHFKSDQQYTDSSVLENPHYRA